MTQQQMTETEMTLAEAAALTFEQWRITGELVATLASGRAMRIAKEAQAADEDAAKRSEVIDERRLRELNALVLTARRVMELEDRYEQKVHSRSPAGCRGEKAGNAEGPNGASVNNDLVKRFDELARAAGVTITVKQPRPVDAAGRAAE